MYRIYYIGETYNVYRLLDFTSNVSDSGHETWRWLHTFILIAKLCGTATVYIFVSFVFHPKVNGKLNDKFYKILNTIYFTFIY